jgi:glycerol kinase
MVRRWSASTEPGELAELARTASSNDVYLVPGFTGLGALYWDAQAVGLISGLDFGTVCRS